MKKHSLLVAGVLICAVHVRAQTAPRVHTREGDIEGTSDGRVRSFLGIPYAAPPVGELRWRPTQPHAAWKNVMAAKNFGSRFMQVNAGEVRDFRDPGMSEDCLTVNVWTAAKPGEKLPVMVWVHGGGLRRGSSSTPRTDGRFFAQRGVVLVSINYRLGVFGFLTHPELNEESTTHSSGNYGLMDIAAALRWVQQNVAEFGGDPANVTLFGQSGGSTLVCAEMASPIAHGLFARVIGESGGTKGVYYGRWFQPLSVAQKQDAAEMQAVFPGKSLAGLRQLSAQEIIDATSVRRPETGREYLFGAQVDGYVLPQAMDDIYAQHKQNDVPLLMGWNRDERNVDTSVTVGSYQKRVRERFPGKAEELLRLYPAKTDGEAVTQDAQLRSDTWDLTYSGWNWANLQATYGRSATYRYHFDHAPPPDTAHPLGNTAYHAAEIPYVFGTLSLTGDRTWTPADEALSATMQRYWINFARTGSPDGPGLPAWPKYDPSSWKVMYFDGRDVAERDRGRERFLVLDGLYPFHL